LSVLQVRSLTLHLLLRLLALVATSTLNLVDNGIHQHCGTGWPERVRQRNKDHKGTEGCHDNRVKKNLGKLLKERDHGKDHDHGGANGRKGSGENRRSHAQHGVLGSLVAAAVPRETAVCMGEMDYKICGNANEDGDAYTLQTEREGGGVCERE